MVRKTKFFVLRRFDHSDFVGRGTMADERSLYRFNGVAHIADSINEEPSRCIYSVWRQQNMPLHDRIIPYLERAGLYHIARLNTRWFWINESLVSTFIERWRLEAHTFHKSFEEFTITLQDVGYQLCNTLIFKSLYSLKSGFKNYLVSLPRRIWVLPADATETTVRIYALAYIMMLLSTQLFGDKSGNRIHIRWLPFVAKLDEMGTYN
ncbi:protein MAIN-LIKE 1-like [Arachis stenosperma]|uniref:protein MAIN-LIKE 1-like n=1 Tax=Arachis stenosperma TaxID=217475 RepID=UPI0025AC651D|nr:protein MAIN-LIKE 1-like [Arachis stenosperma]